MSLETVKRQRSQSRQLLVARAEAKEHSQYQL